MLDCLLHPSLVAQGTNLTSCLALTLGLGGDSQSAATAMQTEGDGDGETKATAEGKLESSADITAWVHRILATMSQNVAARLLLPHVISGYSRIVAYGDTVRWKR